MSESLNNSFLKNITDKMPTYTLKHLKESVKKTGENLWNGIFEISEAKNSVFSGDISREISKTESRLHAFGVAMRDYQPKSSFNMYF